MLLEYSTLKPHVFKMFLPLFDFIFKSNKIGLIIFGNLRFIDLCWRSESSRLRGLKRHFDLPGGIHLVDLVGIRVVIIRSSESIVEF